MILFKVVSNGLFVLNVRDSVQPPHATTKLEEANCGEKTNNEAPRRN